MGDVTVVNVIVRSRDSLTRNLEAANGIEPMNKGFADLRLTTWLRRPRITSLSFSASFLLRALHMIGLFTSFDRDRQVVLLRR